MKRFTSSVSSLKRILRVTQEESLKEIENFVITREYMRVNTILYYNILYYTTLLI